MTTKASELVKALQAAILRYGDLPVETVDSYDPEVSVVEDGDDIVCNFLIDGFTGDED